MDNRGIIAQALGALAERTGLTIPEAFTQLRTHSRNNRVRLSDLARDVLDGSLTLDGLQVVNSEPSTIRGVYAGHRYTQSLAYPLTEHLGRTLLTSENGVER